MLVKKERKKEKTTNPFSFFFQYQKKKEKKISGIAELVFVCECKDGDGMHSG